MNTRLEEQIRRYTESMDAMAPPIEELVPVGLAKEMDLAPGESVEITIPLTPVTRAYRAPGWAIGLAAALAVLAIAMPLLFWASDEAPDVVASTTPVPVETTVPPPVNTTILEPGSTDRFVALDVLASPRVNGMGWPAEASVRVSVDGGVVWETIGNVGPDGTFDLPVPAPVPAGVEFAVDVGSVITQSRIPVMTVTELDVNLDRVIGTTDLPAEGSCCVSVFMFTSPSDDQAEGFPFEIRSDGTWIADLEGSFDITNFTSLDVVYGDPGGLWISWSHSQLTDS